MDFIIDHLTLFAVIIFVAVVLIVGWVQSRKDTSNPIPAIPSIDQLISRYGEPDDIILVNPTRGNDAESAVLVYNTEHLLMVAGEPVDMSAVTDVSFSNYGLPYTPNDYRIILVTSVPGKEVIRIPVGAGNDAEYAKLISQQIRNAIQLS